MLEGHAYLRSPGRVKVDNVNSIEKICDRRLQFG